MTGSGMFFARAEWRNQWRAHLALAAIVALVVGAVLATLMAASRSEQAFTRLRSATAAADVAAFVGPREGDDPEQFDAAKAVRELQREVAAIDGVVQTSAETEPFVRPAGRDDLFPDYNLFPRAPLSRRDLELQNKPVIVAGRAVNPKRADEVVLSEKLAADLGVSVGDVLPLETLSDEWVDVAYNGGPPPEPGGPIDATVVGIARSPADFGRFEGIMHLSPAFVSEYRDEMRVYTHVEAKIAGGGEPSPAMKRRFDEVTGADTVGVSVFGDDGSTRDGLDTIARALRIVAVVAAIVGAVVVCLAVARLARVTFREHGALRALGWTRRQFASTAVLAFGPALLLGVGVGLIAGTVVAPRALVGLAGRVDPYPHRVLVDGPALLLVAVGAVVLGLVAAAVAGHRSRRIEARRTRPVPRLLRLDRPLPGVLGVRRALTGESELGGRTSRGAAVVLALAVVGAVAALMVSASIERLEADPALYGSGGDGRQLDAGESLDVYNEALPRLVADERVKSVFGLHIGLTVRSGRERVPLLAVDPVRGEVPASVIEGRVPADAHEVGLGPATLDLLDARVGDRVRLRLHDRAASYRVVGSILFPEGDFVYDEGAAMSVDGAERLLDPADDAASASFVHQIEFEWAHGVNAARADRALEAEGFTVFSRDDPDEPLLVPARVRNLGEVERVPRYLAVFLGVLALVTLGHALATSARRRAQETATLRALGLTRRAGAAIVAVQAATIVLVALVIGLPAGLLLGDRIWTVIAEGAHVIVVTIAPVVGLAAFVAVIVVLAVIATVGPTWRTARLRPGEALRAE